MITIEHQAENFGIDLRLMTEEYTSTRCPICKKIDKTNRAGNIFLCANCGYTAHSDLNGAENILEKGMHSLQLEQKVHWGEIAPSVGVA